MSKELNEEIILQKKQVFSSNCKVNLIAACTPENGILVLDDIQKSKAIQEFDSSYLKPVFFIPASGSGSRMFQFLFEWLETKVETDLVKSFFDHVEGMAFFKAHSLELKDKEAFVRQLLDASQLNLGERPKGLVPFHEENGVYFTAFQDQVRQAFQLTLNDTQINFTIQPQFEDEIKLHLKSLNLLVQLNFSYQEESTNAFCFDEHEELIEANGVPLLRPAGHGALLENLNEIDSDIILIKNIDNVQHTSKSELTAETWKEATGVLIKFQRELKELSNNYSIEKLNALNSVYQFLSPSEIDGINEAKFTSLINRPSRVCGMVKNEGEPGGGPFWVEVSGNVTKQIIEKIQISNDSDQQDIVSGSTHFNPVFIVASKTDCNGKRLNLLDFRDNEAFFVVEKSQQGKKVFYRELPGLWNGAMSNWNTIFLDIPSETFSPVKTIVDLTKVAHLEG
ncbi:MAG: DUF4301 family protein [Crocinitomicaceae bacterium]|nr:DUF4301 family protein [Crocinitomicaceae bacterium]